MIPRSRIIFSIFSGAVSKAIVDAAGASLQLECHSEGISVHYCRDVSFFVHQSQRLRGSLGIGSGPSSSVVCRMFSSVNIFK